MSNISYALRNIVGDSKNICCLCLSICDMEDLMSFEDEANIICPENMDRILISDLVKAVLGSEFLKYVQIMTNICKTCALSLENSYTFITNCNSKAGIMSKIVEGLNTPLDTITKTEGTLLYISVNLEDFSSKLLYDSRKVHSEEQALEHFRYLTTPKKETNSKPNTESSSLDTIQCLECDKIFKSKSNLRYHYTKIHTQLSYKCSKCPKAFKSIAILKAHDIYSHIKMTCDDCGKTFNSRKAWNAHQICHKTSIVCTKCGRTYKNKATYKNHLNLNICGQKNRHSPIDAKYTCDYCNKKYTQKTSLKVHIQFEHGNYKGHICEWCGKKFWAQSRLKAHIVTHTREKNFACSMCNKKFVTKESLLYHTRLHTGEKPYKCSECSSTFLSASRRSDHYKRHHVGAKSDLQCDKCLGKFKTNNALIKHKRTHIEVTPCKLKIPKIEWEND